MKNALLVVLSTACLCKFVLAQTASCIYASSFVGILGSYYKGDLLERTSRISLFGRCKLLKVNEDHFLPVGLIKVSRRSQYTRFLLRLIVMVVLLVLVTLSDDFPFSWEGGGGGYDPVLSVGFHVSCLRCVWHPC